MSFFRNFPAFIAVFLALGAAHSEASGLIHADGQYFKDQQGRIVLLRGINVSNQAKVPPFLPLSDLADLQRIKDLGFNTLRLLFIWEAFEPQPGQYDFAYLDRMGQIVDAAGKLGIYSVLDFHQDGFSRYTVGGCGSGAPAWTLPPGQAENPDNTSDVCKLWNLWEAFEFLIPFASFNEGLRDFYDDKYGARSHYMDVWTQVARYFKKYPTVIGYDMLNEPWGIEQTDIHSVYEDAAARIRAEDPQSVLFVEPEVFTALGWSDTFLPEPSFGNFAYAPHAYDAFALGFGLELNGGLAVDLTLAIIRNRARIWDAPIFVGEFGVQGTGGLFLGSLLKNYYEHLDKHFTSSAQWDYSPNWTAEQQDGWNHENMSVVDSNRQIRGNLIVRAYASAVAGVPVDMSTDLSQSGPDNPYSREFDFTWMNDPSLGETVFTIPGSVAVSAPRTLFQSENQDLACALSADTQTLNCHSPTAGIHHIRISLQND